MAQDPNPNPNPNPEPNPNPNPIPIPIPNPNPNQAACFLTPEQGAAPSVHAAAAQPAPTSLYFCPYLTSARLQPLLELAGPSVETWPDMAGQAVRWPRLAKARAS